MTSYFDLRWFPGHHYAALHSASLTPSEWPGNQRNFDPAPRVGEKRYDENEITL